MEPNKQIKTPPKIQQFRDAFANDKEIEIDIGDEVVCDICDEDFTTSDAKGGFIFGSNAYCPKCAERGLTNIKKYNEEKFIRAVCGENETFHDFVMRMRGGINTMSVTHF